MNGLITLHCVVTSVVSRSHRDAARDHVTTKVTALTESPDEADATFRVICSRRRSKHKTSRVIFENDGRVEIEALGGARLTIVERHSVTALWSAAVTARHNTNGRAKP